MIKCSKCGTELPDDSNFCTYCGNKIEVTTGSRFKEDTIVPNMQLIEPNIVTTEETDVSKSLFDEIKDKCASVWNKLSLYGKIVTIVTAIFILIYIIGLLTGKTSGLFFIFQISLVVVSILMHKGVIKIDQKNGWLKYLVLAVAILFTLINIASYSRGAKTTSTNQDPSAINESSENNTEHIDWGNIVLSNVLPEPQFNAMEVIYNDDDLLIINAHNISEKDFLEYVQLCKENKGFTVDNNSFDDFFYAFNSDGYCVTIHYDDSSEELSINLNAPNSQTTNSEITESITAESVITENATTDSNKMEKSDKSAKDNTEVQQSTNNELSITKGMEYAYMTDEWNVYIATAISDDIIKIANWNKTSTLSKSVSHEYDVGTFKISDSNNEFAWVDDEHTAFVITFKDKKNSDFKKGGTATFTINISDDDKNKGSNYSEKIACFSYENDDWHMYRAIPMTETLIKIECWYRGSSLDKFMFGYDVCLIDTTRGDTDFEWTDDEHTSFSITMKDKKNNWYWKKDIFVLYILENKDYTHFDVKSYLGTREVGEGEVAVPASALDYKYDNYQDVQRALENAGFTNITTSIKYDIIWGWTDEGEVESVSINGRTDYEKGDIFKNNTPIVITYHMKYEDDPNKEANDQRITLTMSEDDFADMSSVDAEAKLREMGFTKFEYRSVDTETQSNADTICYIVITESFFGTSNFVKGDKFNADSTVTLYSYKYVAPKAQSPVFYSTNDYDTAKKGNTGVFSYRNGGNSYDIYWIIDFDEEYVYYFTDGNGESFCDRLKIDSGTLNDYITITYHDGSDNWSYKLHFKYENHPETLIMVDQNGFDWEYSTTDLDDALSLLSTKTIKDY